MNSDALQNPRPDQALRPDQASHAAPTVQPLQVLQPPPLQSPQPLQSLQPLQVEIRSLTDRAEITDLFDRYLRSLDEPGQEYDESWAAAFFTQDASTGTPAGQVYGRSAVRANVATAMRLFARTVHFGSNYVIEIDGDLATLRGNQLSTHVLAADGELFLSGGRTDNELVRTAAGWRLRRADLHVTWTQGNPPVLPPELG